jgi:hypothetical protein
MELLIQYRYCCDEVRLCLCGTAAANGPFVQAPNDTWVATDQRRNKTEGGGQRDSEENVSQYHYVPQTSHLDCPGCEAETSAMRRELLNAWSKSQLYA